MLCDVTECTGCGCCIAVCPKKCITMKTTEYGNRVAEIDKDNCIECGLCESKCPALQSFKLASYVFPEVYMCYHKDRDVLMNSASGGAFSIIADYVFERGGSVVGAGWENDFTVKFSVANNNSELKKMHGSKYVQSRLETEIYRYIKDSLDKGKLILFCGLPCQCAGIISYLGKDYENFICVDIVCHGAAPDVLLKKHLETLNSEKNRIVGVNHTSKIKKWSILIQKTICYDKSDGSKEYLDRTDDFYLNNFLNHLFFCDSCYQCRFAAMPRITDITIGDFFGLGVVRKAQIPNRVGISMFMINSVKGQKIFPMLKKYGVFERRELEEALYFNHNLWKPSVKNKNTDKFRKDYISNEWENIENIYHNRNWRIKMQINIKKILKKALGDKNICRLMLLYYKRSGIIDRVDLIIEDLKLKTKNSI